MITADRGPAVFGTHNTIVCARAGAGLGVGRGGAAWGGAAWPSGHYVLPGGKSMDRSNN